MTSAVIGRARGRPNSATRSPRGRALPMLGDAYAIPGVLTSSFSGLSLADTDVGGGGGILTTLGAGLAVAVAIFAYANFVYTPEIIKGAGAIRAEQRATDLLVLVKQVQREGKDMDEAKKALEVVFGSTVEEYIAGMEERMKSGGETKSVSGPETELVALLRSVYYER